MSGVFTFLAGSIDSALDAFVVKVSSSLAVGITPIVMIGVTLYIICYGYAVMRNEVSDPVNAFAWKAIKLCLIFGCSLTGGIYQSEIAGGANAIANGLVQLVSPNNADGVFAALDQFDQLAGDCARQMVSHGVVLLPVGGYVDILSGYILLFADVVLLLSAGGWALVAKVALSFVLAFGPLFIVSLAFPPTTKFFDAWLGKVLNYIFLMVFTAAVSTFAILIATEYIIRMNASNGETNALTDVFGFVLLSGGLILLTWQMPNLASGLASGASVSSGGLGGFVMGMVTGRARSNGRGEEKGSASGGGGITKSGNSTGDRATTLKGNRVPAYRRATLDRMNGKK